MSTAEAKKTNKNVCKLYTFTKRDTHFKKERHVTEFNWFKFASSGYRTKKNKVGRNKRKFIIMYEIVTFLPRDTDTICFTLYT